MRNTICYLLLFFGVLFSGCDPDVPDDNTSYVEGKEPVISVTSISEITSRRATVHYRIEDTGGRPLKELRLCYTEQGILPDTANALVQNIPLDTTDMKTIRLSGLIPDKEYALRIFAANQDTAGYSGLQTFRMKEDPSGRGFTELLPYPGEGNTGGNIAFSVGGRGYVGLGGDSDNSNNLYFQDLWAYDPVQESWERKNNFPGVARQKATTMVIGNIVYLIGGHYFDMRNNNKPVFLDDVWAYTPETDTWERKNNFPFGGRCDALSFVIDGKGYLLGGFSRELDYSAFWMYDPQTDVWCKKADFAGRERCRAAGCTFAGKAYVMCGYGIAFAILSDCWAYDPHLDNWERISDFPDRGRTDSKAFFLNDKIYLLGGSINGSSAAENFWVYLPDKDRWETTEQYVESINYSYIPTFIINRKAYIKIDNDGMLSYDPFLDK